MNCIVIEGCNRGYSSGSIDLYNLQNNEVLNHSDGELAVGISFCSSDTMLRPVRHVLYLFSVSQSHYELASGIITNPYTAIPLASEVK